ncbi:peroxiredoxin [Helicobacter ailurogastricus]|uniref:26 kDa antigen n=1 Tax=Helicobacter ailurogastricus TaxID=1578720 RepID=A0A0K2X3R0_9HELI|nr:peroxiredoxin [Helicobacter ailurogastricus]CRF40451.1 Alkyl hydroperoxide reductase subunit C-like protein [Helicobacter ailurogastricus]CRF43424.1 Alkyl hydroperoxide reductase subunit C-like protein [Helicobacter ailurogastricus]CRF43977.1 Alkyl hydroperoxide reductase subunit C-like protein [Helicobacter ailurogastricus]CRF52533.1 Alkyl hydroperoxide reductase subunit C-like protein [Helicobacter ailurogastricus]BDQ29671.1 putative peroxiredoxin [Helicobacter ailurogastricus]
MLVTKVAPDFKATAVLPNNQVDEHFELSKNLGRNGVVLFFWPKDFTFVCPSEIIAFDHRVKEFNEKGFNVIGVSTDTEVVHYAWKNTPVERGGIGQVTFPLIADVTKDISRAYDVLFENAIALRGSFLIDKHQKIRHAVINDFPLGRNVDEMLRMVDALIFFEEHGEVCPAGWQKGDAGMKASHEGVAEYLKEHASRL